MNRILAFAFASSLALTQFASAEDDGQRVRGNTAPVRHASAPSRPSISAQGPHRPLNVPNQSFRQNGGARFNPTFSSQPHARFRPYTPTNGGFNRTFTPTRPVTPAAAALTNTTAVPQPAATLNRGNVTGSTGRYGNRDWRNRDWRTRNGNDVTPGDISPSARDAINQDWRNRTGANQDWRNRTGGNHDWRNRTTGSQGETNLTGTNGDWRNGRHGDWSGGWHDRTHHHRDWWRSRYNRFALFGGGYYYWNSGYWYPAYGYDPYFSSYAYDAPIYGYNDLQPEQVMQSVQTELARQGYYSGEIDGSYGPQTRNALLRYQRDSGLPQTGIVDENTLSALGLQ